MKRLISHSEASAMLDCQFKHSFAYTGQVTGGEALKSKTTAPQLREGGAWGAAVAAFHANGGGEEGLEHALVAMEIRMSLDMAEQQKFGNYDPDAHNEMADKLDAMVRDYAAYNEPITLTRLEDKLEVAIPSRTGKRSSNVYRLEAYLDGVHTDEDGRDWIYEAKLRKRLSDFTQVSLARQTRWYAFSWRELTGRPIAGIIVEERLNAVPAPVKYNKNESLSKVQSCRPDAYVAAGGDDPDVLLKLQAKEWEKRHQFLLSDAELDEAGKQLASVGSLIQQLDAGLLYPVRNPSPMRCPGCAFREICADPTDDELIDALFERRPPKRDRVEEVVHA